MAKGVFEGVENNVVKGENAGYQHFLLVITWDCVVKGLKAMLYFCE